MANRWFIASCAGLVLMAIGTAPVAATTVKTFAFEEICETAQTIVHVRCLARENAVFPNRKGVFTQTRFRVLKVVKGQADADSEMALVLPGGEWEGQRTYVPGIPQFAAGKETVLFLSKTDKFGSPWPVGLGQGCYPVQVDEGENRRIRLVQGHTPLPPDVRAKPATASHTDMSLRDFLDAVRDVLDLPKDDSPSKQ